MGLDMYLIGKKSLWDLKKESKKIEKIFPELKEFEPEKIVFELGKWRKANAIHKWFVENVQDGKDDNGEESWVSKKQLQELLDLVKEVLKNKDKAEELLPTQSGFFFGGTEYDEWYFNSLKNTKKIINKVLKLNFDNIDVYYQSSW